MPCSVFKPRLLLCVLLAGMLHGAMHAQTPEPAEDIRGPKPLVEIPVPEKSQAWLYGSIAGGVVLLLAAAWLWSRRTRKPSARPPREIALESLSQLEATRESILAEAFANRAAQAVRQYIAGHFNIVAPRLTTEEFLNTLARDKDSPLSAESDHLRVFLKSCDLAKFAGANLDFNQRVELIDAARNFVRSTSRATTP